MHECSIWFLEFLRLNFYLFEYWPDLFTSGSVSYHIVYILDYIKVNSTLVIFRECLDLLLFQAIVL
jgi:hypothetical protein